MPNATIVNFASGETSPKSRGRFDIASYNSSCRKLENFIAEVQGSARFRNGFRFKERVREYAYGTAGACRLIPFQINDDDSYMLEFTPGKMRIYRDGALQTLARTTITGITDDAGAAKIAVVSGTGIAIGDEVWITGVVGATELNGRALRVYAVGATEIYVFDPLTGTNLAFADLTTYVSGGTVREVYTIASPYYTQVDMDSITYTQTPSALYLASYRHPPYKATVASNTGTWTLATYSRTADPFVATAALTVTAATPADIGVAATVTLSTPAVSGHRYTIAGVTGSIAASINARWRLYAVESVGGGNVYELYDPTTDDFNTSIAGTYTSGGTATPDADCPIAVAFYESRLVFAGTNVRPNTLFFSRSPVPTTGVARYDDFTGGTDADHACFFTLSPVNGQIDYITWAGGTAKYLLIGTFGGAFRVSGGGLDEPITPSSVNVRQIDSYGCAAYAPALNGSILYYVQRGGVTLRNVRYSADTDDLGSFDMCLNADQVTHSPLKRLVFQAGRPDAVWVLREDGVLASMTVNGPENIAGWHRHTAAGTSAKILDIVVLPRPGEPDQVWAITERVVAGISPATAKRYVEILADDTVFPDIEDYFTAAAAASTDAATYRAAALAVLKTAAHLDAYAVYNSTPATVISGLWHLEGETVDAVADGVHVEDLVVANGTVTLDTAASIVVVGLPYTGLLQTQNLEVGGRSGPAQAKPRNINALNIRFLNSKGGKYGTDLYHMFDIDTEDPDALELADGSAAPVFNGIRALQHSDVWSTDNDRNEKTVFIQQTKPFPCVVQFIDIEYETGDE